MEQQHSQHHAATEPRPPQDRQRCHARNRDRSHCRLNATDPLTGLCTRHANRANADRLDDSIDLSSEILEIEQGSYGSTDNINAILSNLVVLVAKGRISTRRAAVITYALSLMLRSVVTMNREAANTPPQIIFDVPRPDRSEDTPASKTGNDSAAQTPASPTASSTSTPMNSLEARERYRQLRS
jgi:hypothetical protein